MPRKPQAIKSSALPDGKCMVSEINKKQRKILACLGINAEILTQQKT